MMVVRVILFLITTTMAKHHHSTDPNDNFYGSVYVAIHSVVDDIFESIGLGTNFTNESNTKLLLTMHYDLSNILEKTFETFDDIKKIIKDVSNQSYFIYSFNETEEDVTKLDTIVKEVLNRKNFDVYGKIKGSQNKRAKDKTIVKDKSTQVISNPAFDDSKEFTEFVVNFLAKVNNLTIQDFKKSSKHGRIAVPSQKNLKVWDTPSSLKYDLINYTRRMFRFSKTQMNSYPFIVSIHIMGEFTCSGCIISRGLVITAASCLHIAYKNDFFEKNLKSIYVRHSSDHTTRDGETIPVQNLYFHPEYEPKHLLNNLAILKLEKRIRFSRQQKRIRRILWDKTPGVLPNETKSIIIVGWGATKKDQVTQKHPKLRVRMLDVYNTDDCRQKYTKDFITKENFCAALNRTNGGACNGDVGGPGIVGAVLMGVVSFGAPECGAVGAPTVFTKLGYYVPWIDSIMNSKINQTNYDIINTRRKSKFTRSISKPARNNKLHGSDEDYLEEVRALRDILIELMKTDQSLVDNVIYGDLYDDFNKYLESKEQIESKEKLISTENKRNNFSTTTKGIFELKIELEPDPEDTTSNHTPLYSTSVKFLSLRKPPIDSEYETDNDAAQNDYTDNYEQSSEEEHRLDIKIPNMKKRIESKQDVSTYSESESDQQTANSEKIEELFARNRPSPQKNYVNNMHTAPPIYFTGSRSYGDNVDTKLREGKGRQIPKKVLMKHDQLSKHASSVLDEGRSLATKNFIINFDTTDRYLNYDKHKYKNNKPEKAISKSNKKSNYKSGSSETKSESFLIQF